MTLQDHEMKRGQEIRWHLMNFAKVIYVGLPELYEQSGKSMKIAINFSPSKSMECAKLRLQKENVLGSGWKLHVLGGWEVGGMYRGGRYTPTAILFPTPWDFEWVWIACETGHPAGKISFRYPISNGAKD